MTYLFELLFPSKLIEVTQKHNCHVIVELQNFKKCKKKNVYKIIDII